MSTFGVIFAWWYIVGYFAMWIQLAGDKALRDVYFRMTVWECACVPLYATLSLLFGGKK